ncbi:MAG: hypothetical protein AAF750_04785 [Planctomycetota bacterium]
MTTHKLRVWLFLLPTLCLCHGLSGEPVVLDEERGYTEFDELGLKIKVPSGWQFREPDGVFQNATDTLVPGLKTQLFVSIIKPDPRAFAPAELPEVTFDFHSLSKPAALSVDEILEHFHQLREKMDQPGVAIEPPTRRDLGRCALVSLRVHEFGATNNRQYSMTLEFVAFAEQRRVDNEIVETGPVYAIGLVIYDASRKERVQEIDSLLFGVLPHKRPVD